MRRRDPLRAGVPALQLLDDAVHAVRAAPAGVLARYYVGAVPFVLGFLFFWTEMSRSPFAAGFAAEASLALALLFVWMKAWQAEYASRLLASLAGRAPERPGLRRVVRMVFVQAALQPTAFLVLPLAFLATAPTGWAVAFYQSLTATGDGSEAAATPATAAARAWRAARLWPGQNHALVLTLTLLGSVVLLNLALLFAVAPELLRSLLGIETAFSRGGWNPADTTILTVLGGVAYLCVDPLVKAAYALRCFYGEARGTGCDLRADLARVPRAALLLLALVLASGVAGPGRTEAAPVPPPAFRPADLDRSVERVLARPDFSWRLPVPRDARSAPDGPLLRFLRKAGGTLARWAAALATKVRAFAEWLSDLLPAARNLPAASGKGRAWLEPPRLLVAALLGVLGVGLVGLRRWARRRAVAPVDAPGEPAPDVGEAEPDVAALPEEGWLRLAEELFRGGDSRLGLRAVYLATLAHLGRRGLVRLERHKSNREYAAELARRARDVPELLDGFGLMLRLVERTWYGEHPVSDEVLRGVLEARKRVFGHAPA